MDLFFILSLENQFRVKKKKAAFSCVHICNSKNPNFLFAKLSDISSHNGNEREPSSGSRLQTFRRQK